MKKKRKVWGVILIILGVILLSGSFYIKSQVKAGQKQVSQAESTTGFGDKILSLTPETKNLGDKLSSPIQDKVKEGKEQIAFYTNIANWLNILGIISIILGIGTLLGARRKST